VLLVKEEKVLQDMIDKLIEIGRCYGIYTGCYWLRKKRCYRK